ncbi:hypothetical protein C8T65DRAFT_696754 [Cerioporus squamosus]|nr:hypothetical protein C8T65DRAFT_696754 [Cerioporus squamosus]
MRKEEDVSANYQKWRVHLRHGPCHPLKRSSTFNAVEDWYFGRSSMKDMMATTPDLTTRIMVNLEVRTASGLYFFDMSQAQLVMELSDVSSEVIIKSMGTLPEMLHIRLADRKSLWKFIAAFGVTQSPGRLGSPSIGVSMKNELDLDLLDSILGSIKEMQDELERTWGTLEEEV